jgi:hypothetical protein
LSLEDYVIALKDLVGLETLINVVGIGKEDGLSNLSNLTEVVSHPELLKDLASQNCSNESNTSGVSSNTANYLPKDVSIKGTNFEINLPIAIEKVEGDETIVNDVAAINSDDHENQLRIRDVESLRKSRRPPKPSTKALEAVVDKYEEETNCKRRTNVETLRKSRRPSKSSTTTLEVVVDKYEGEETTCERRLDIETLRKSRRPPKPSTKALEAVVDKYEEEETSCKRRQDVESLRKSRRSPKPSTKTVEAVVDKYEEEASRKRRRV